jgi:hypothetical protein
LGVLCERERKREIRFPVRERVVEKSAHSSRGIIIIIIKSSFYHYEQTAARANLKREERNRQTRAHNKYGSII